MQETIKPITPPTAVTPPPAQGKGQRPQLPGVFFDSDMGRDIDTVLALAVLYGSYAKVKLIGDSVTSSSLDAAAFCDVVGRFYAGPVSNAPFSPSYYNPVGLAEDGTKLPNGSMLSKALALKNPEGKPLLVHNIKDITDTADVRICLRNALLTQKDGEGTVVMAGPATNLIHALALPGNKEIITAKTAVLVIAAGAYPAGQADPRIKIDVAAARRLLVEWPSPIVAVGLEVGQAVPFPGASIATDFAWSPNHPVVAAYNAYKPMPYDAPSQAVAAALYAANRTGEYFQLSAPGTIRVLDDGRTQFEPSPSGRHRYLIVADGQKERILKEYATAASAKPAVPPVRNRPQQADQAPAKIAQ